MTRCPRCQATLPDAIQQCQFCGTVLAAPPPVRAPARGTARNPGRSNFYQSSQPRWVWPAYYAIAGWWVLDGVRAIATSAAFGGGIGLGTIVGALSALIGLGLILRIELARGIVNVLCFLQILDGGLGLILGFFMTGVVGIWGAIGMIFSAIRIALGILMIFLIGETDSRAPNI